MSNDVRKEGFGARWRRSGFLTAVFGEQYGPLAAACVAVVEYGGIAVAMKVGQLVKVTEAQPREVAARLVDRQLGKCLAADPAQREWWLPKPLTDKVMARRQALPPSSGGPVPIGSGPPAAAAASDGTPAAEDAPAPGASIGSEAPAETMAEPAVEDAGEDVEAADESGQPSVPMVVVRDPAEGVVEPEAAPARRAIPLGPARDVPPAEPMADPTDQTAEAASAPELVIPPTFGTAEPVAQAERPTGRPSYPPGEDPLWDDEAWEEPAGGSPAHPESVEPAKALTAETLSGAPAAEPESAPLQGAPVQPPVSEADDLGDEPWREFHLAEFRDRQFSPPEPSASGPMASEAPYAADSLESPTARWTSGFGSEPEPEAPVAQPELDKPADQPEGHVPPRWPLVDPSVPRIPTAAIRRYREEHPDE